MTIVKIQGEVGFHAFESQSHREKCWLPGYIEVPQTLEADLIASGGWCELTIENGVLASVTPTEKPAPDPAPPTELEQLRADIDFIAAMQGVIL